MGQDTLLHRETLFVVPTTDWKLIPLSTLHPGHTQGVSPIPGTTCFS